MVRTSPLEGFTANTTIALRYQQTDSVLWVFTASRCSCYAPRIKRDTRPRGRTPVRVAVVEKLRGISNSQLTATTNSSSRSKYSEPPRRIGKNRLETTRHGGNLHSYFPSTDSDSALGTRLRGTAVLFCLVMRLHCHKTLVSSTISTTLSFLPLRP